VLGDESFVQKLRDRVKGLHKERREITALRQGMHKERGLEARNVAMWMIWESGTKSLLEIGELFGGLDYAAVAQRIRRTRLAHDARTKRKLLGEMSNVEI